ncbi:MAG: Cro/C1-type DNA-binding domain [Clostridium butyricum]|nr:Cro/C1-type DNA-binding domain [Clostridium butyricum]
MKATKLKIARTAECLGQKELAKMVGISHVTLGKAERGDIDNIKFGTIKKIAAVLNSTVEELFLSEEN